MTFKIYFNIIPVTYLRPYAHINTIEKHYQVKTLGELVYNNIVLKLLVECCYVIGKSICYVIALVLLLYWLLHYSLSSVYTDFANELIYEIYNFNIAVKNTYKVQIPYYYYSSYSS